MQKTSYTSRRYIAKQRIIKILYFYFIFYPIRSPTRKKPTFYLYFKHNLWNLGQVQRKLPVESRPAVYAAADAAAQLWRRTGIKK